MSQFTRGTPQFRRRQRYLKRWRALNAEDFRRMQADWYRRRGKQHYASRREQHAEASIRCQGRRLGLTRSQIMSRIRSVSMLEIAARPLVTERAGCRMVHQPMNVPGHPDYANKSRKVACFVHGCFFHSCPEHGTVPKSNGPFWLEKFAGNRRRHRRAVRALRKEGWRVILIWEHEVRSYLREVLA